MADPLFTIFCQEFEMTHVVMLGNSSHPFKGLVALEIIIDLPFGFPINNIISL